MMTPERWQLIKELFHSALEREPGRRDDFLAESCAADRSLRAQIESLIAAHEETGSFLNAPAYQVAAELLVDDGAELAAGQSVGPYQIISLLSAGGMGEVYLAKDTRLGRQVALKLLPASFVKDADRLRRFEQEARTASTLNHPNICVIYEVGETDDGRHFIAMEYIEGVTLRHRLAQKGMDLGEVLDVAAQIASALAVAHAAGIAHRDIKPENIMVRPDGYIKVLDFGLAKPLEAEPLTVESEQLTRSRVDTRPGLLIGTVKYMSPEQTRGLKVDARTDIWSLGVVLYEMIAGQSPFEGSTTSDLIVSILEKEPPPLWQFSPDIPSELQRIEKKALRKDREERYQTIRDMALDLKNLGRELQVSGETEIESATERSATARGDTGETVATAELPSRGRATRAGTVITTSSIGSIAGKIRRHGRNTGIVLAALVIAAGIFYGPRQFFSKKSSSVAPFQSVQLTRLTTSGNAIDAAVSPDGKYVVYVADTDGQQSLWVRQVATASNVQIVPPASVTYQGLSFSPDSNYIYYNLWDRKGVGVIFQVPALGGTSNKVIVDVMPSIGVSPDGKRIAFIRGYAAEHAQALMVANADGSAERSLAKRNDGDGSFWHPAWSPDGKRIACVSANPGSQDVRFTQVIEVPAEGGPERPITSMGWFAIESLAWASDGGGLIMTATDQPRSPLQIWHLSYPEGRAQKITNDVNGFDSLSLTADSTALVSVQSNIISNIWVAPSGNTGQAKKISSGRYEGLGLSWTPDGRIVYGSAMSGNPEIWVMNADGTEPKQLTRDDSEKANPTVTSDGRYIIYESYRTGVPHLWRMNIDGSNQEQLTNGRGEWSPSCSPAGQWLVYLSVTPGKENLWKMSVDGGEQTQLTDKFTYRPVVSPDGKLVAYSYWDEQAHPQQFGREIISIETKQKIRSFDVPLSAVNSSGRILLRWTADGRALTYIDSRDGISNIWGLSLADGQPKRLTDFKEDRIFFFEWSRDGKYLACSRGIITNDVVMLKDAE